MFINLENNAITAKNQRTRKKSVSLRKTFENRVTAHVAESCVNNALMEFLVRREYPYICTHTYIYADTYR